MKSLFFDSCIWSTSPKVEAAVEFLKDKLVRDRVYTRWHPHFTDHLKLIILNVFHAYTQDPDAFVAYYRSKNPYSSNLRYTPFPIRYQPIINLIDALDISHFGYLETLKGYFNRNINKGQISRMRASGLLLELLLDTFNFDSNVIERHPNEPTIILKKKLQQFITVEAGKNIARQVTQKIPFAETPETIAMRSKLGTINAALNQHFIGLCLSDMDMEALRERLKKESKDDFLKVVDFSRTKLRRIFNNGTFEDGGRFYGGWWQVIPSDLRKHIRIDNKTTVERDYSGMQVSLLYANEGLQPSDDAYLLERFPKEARGILKKTLQVMFNTKSPHAAIMTMEKEDPLEEHQEITGIQSYQDVLNGFEEKHPAICHYFYTGCGIKMQREDSDIAEAVMLRLIADGIPVLPIHDSFIVRRDHQAALLRAMDYVIDNRYGVKFNHKQDQTAYEAGCDFLWDKVGAEDLPSQEAFETDWTNQKNCQQYFRRLEEWEAKSGIRLEV